MPAVDLALNPSSALPLAPADTTRPHLGYRPRHAESTVLHQVWPPMSEGPSFTVITGDPGAHPWKWAAAKRAGEDRS